MKSNFKKSLTHVLKHEGGYVDHPKDPGGATNKGVTIATFRRYVKRNGTKTDLRNISNDQVQTVYKKQYWDKVRGDELPSGVDYAMFDFGVNSGPSRPIKFVQRILGLLQDGKLGPLTLAAIQKVSPVFLIEKLCDARLAWMKTLRVWPTFGRGWSSRVSSVKRMASQMAHDNPTKIETRPNPKPINVDAPNIPRVPDGLDKSMVKSKTNWLTTLLGGIGSVGSFFVGLDPIIQALLIVVIVGAVGWVIYERKRYADEARAIKAAL